MLDYPILPTEDNTPLPPPPPKTPTSLIDTLRQRYSDAYFEAHTVVGIGSIVKGVGVVLALIILVGGFVIASSSGIGGLAGMGFALACLVGIPTYVLGILVTAQGQTQLAILDTAINGSRHLSDDDVAQLLLKRFSISTGNA
jgi:hypothetical protein